MCWCKTPCGLCTNQGEISGFQKSLFNLLRFSIRFDRQISGDVCSACVRVHVCVCVCDVCECLNVPSEEWGLLVILGVVNEGLPARGFFTVYLFFTIRFHIQCHYPTLEVTRQSGSESCPHLITQQVAELKFQSRPTYFQNLCPFHNITRHLEMLFCFLER